MEEERGEWVSREALGGLRKALEGFCLKYKNSSSHPFSEWWTQAGEGESLRTFLFGGQVRWLPLCVTKGYVEAMASRRSHQPGQHQVRSKRCQGSWSKGKVRWESLCAHLRLLSITVVKCCNGSKAGLFLWETYLECLWRSWGHIIACNMWEFNSPMFHCSHPQHMASPLHQAQGVWVVEKLNSMAGSLLSNMLPARCESTCSGEQRVQGVSEMSLNHRSQKELCVQRGLQHSAGCLGMPCHWHYRLGTKISASFSSWSLALSSHW